MRRHREAAAACARDFDRAPPGYGTAGNELGEHPVGHLAQLETVGISKREQRREHQPNEGRFEHTGKTLAKQNQRDQPDERRRHDFGFPRRAVESRKFGQGRFILLQHEHEKCDGENGEQDPEQAAHGGVLQPTLNHIPFMSS